jgi:hypothetical protein
VEGVGEVALTQQAVEVTGIWLRGGENEVTVLAEIGGEWREVITEYMPASGNDGTVWPISHIVEVGGITRE